MSLRICTVIFFCSSDGPASLTSFRLNRSPDASRKKTKKTTSVACPAKAIRFAEPHDEVLLHVDRRFLDLHALNPLGDRIGPSRLVRGALQLLSRALDVLDGRGLSMSHCLPQLRRGVWQRRDDGDRIVRQRIGGVAKRTGQRSDDDR